MTEQIAADNGFRITITRAGGSVDVEYENIEPKNVRAVLALALIEQLARSRTSPLDLELFMRNLQFRAQREVRQAGIARSIITKAQS